MARRATPSATQADLPLQLERYRTHLRASAHSPETIRSYTEVAREFIALQEREGRPLLARQVGRTDIEAYLAHLRDRGLAQATLRLRFRSLAAFFSWLVEDEVLRETPFRRLRAPAYRREPPTLITGEQLRLLLASVRTPSGPRDSEPAFLAVRNRALLSLAISTGVRRGEMASIRVDDVDMTNLVVRVDGKTGPRRIPLYGRTVRDLANYLDARRRHPYAGMPQLWLGRKGVLTREGITNVVERHLDAVGLADHSMHDLRHAWASHSLRNGASEGDVMRAGGWRSVTLVHYYSEVDAEERALESLRLRGPGTLL